MAGPSAALLIALFTGSQCAMPACLSGVPQSGPHLNEVPCWASQALACVHQTLLPCHLLIRLAQMLPDELSLPLPLLPWLWEVSP